MRIPHFFTQRYQNTLQKGDREAEGQWEKAIFLRFSRRIVTEQWNTTNLPEPSPEEYDIIK